MTLNEIKEKFNLPTLTVQEGKDKYGKLVTIKELGFTVYKKDLELGLGELTSAHDYAMSENALASLREMCKRDNHYAEFMGMRQYEVLRVRMLRNNWYGVEIRFLDNGEIRNALETSLSWALHSEDNMKKYLQGGRHYFVAGGLDKDADFIFHGVGHSSKSEMYSFEEDEVVLA